VTYAIHPAVGVARVGNAPALLSDSSSFYLGAESPMQVPNDGGSYKANGRIKKQAQRFRIYQFEDGVAQRELTLEADDVASIEWTVSVANRKAALDLSAAPGSRSLPRVLPPAGEWGPERNRYGPAGTRNPAVPEGQRARLCIETGARSVGAGVGQADLSGTITFAPGRSPVSKEVTLGRIAAEADTGRLLVFAGDGMSEGLLNGTFSPLPSIEEQNNDNWYDDTFDGWVQAEITFVDGTRVPLDQPDQRAWVIASVPRYAPSLDWLTTLWDVARSAIHPASRAVPRPSFAEDIYPILRSASLLQWVTARAAMGHGLGRSGGYYLARDILLLLSANDRDRDSDAFKARQGVFSRIRPPDAPVDTNTIQMFMPQVSNDLTDPTGHYAVAAVTELQYAMLARWRDGDFDADGVPPYVPLQEMDMRRRPAALDRAALEGTAGAPFYPGIESWRIMASPACYVRTSVFRISGDVQPGDLTIGNALPWQGDFLDCSDIWWPVQRPNEVTRDGRPLQPWVPPAWIPDEDNPEFTQMVLNWWRLGFVVTRDGSTYEEVEGTAGDANP
jgi:hypothetical protein